MFRRSFVSLGVGGTAFLVASAIGFEVFGGDFPSIFYVLPIALLAMGVAAIGTYLYFGRRSRRVIRSGLTGVAAISYAFFALWFVRYAIASTRSVLSFDLIASISVVIAVIVTAVVWIYDQALEERA